MNETADPPTLADPPIFSSSLKVGTLCGTGGLLLGGVVGTIRTRTPVLFTLVSGFQWFILGSTFWAARSTLLSQGWQDLTISGSDRQKASGIAGAITGGVVGGITRGRTNIIPGTLVVGSFAYFGDRLHQTVSAKLEERRESYTHNSDSRKSAWQSLVSSRWFPMKPISDEEYRDRLKEQLLQVDAEIAILKDDMEAISTQVKPQSDGDRSLQLVKDGDLRP